MGKDGDVTNTALKSATNINDSRLSGHHPNGPGNQTQMSDFFVGGIGSWKDVDDDTVEEFVKEWTEEAVPVTSGGDCPDGQGGNAQLCIGDRFEIAIEVEEGDDGTGGEHAVDQVIFGGDALNYVLTNCELKNRTVETGTSSSYKKIVHEFEVTGADLVEADVTYNDGGYNNDATHYNESIQYDNTDVQTSEVVVEVSDASVDGICSDDVNYTPNITVNDPEDKVGTEGYYIDWGDGNTETWSEGDGTPSHCYASTGTYTVEVELYTDGDQSQAPDGTDRWDVDTANVDVTSGGQT